MRRIIPILALCLLTAPFVGAQTTKKTKAKSAAKTTALKWGPAPAVFPKGAKMAVVSGDPGKAGQFEVQLQMPSGYKFPPHFHPTDEVVQVKKGTFLVGMGDTFDASKTKPMKVGEKATVPAQMHHFAEAKGATTVSVTAMGPFAMTYVNPSDDPQKAAGK